MTIELKQAAQQALEALTFIRRQLKSWDRGDSVIDALRTALAQQPATAIACGIPGMAKTTCPYCGQGFAFEHEQPATDEPFGYIHHFAAHDERGALIDTTWEADGCADPLPHPTSPAMWKWSHCTPFYTPQQPTQAAQAEVTDEQIAACVKRASTYGLPFVGLLNPGGAPSEFSKRFTAEILALRPAAVPMTDEVFDLICNAIDKADTISMDGDYMLDSDDCIVVVRVMQALLSIHHGITAQAKKEQE